MSSKLFVTNIKNWLKTKNVIYEAIDVKLENVHNSMDIYENITQKLKSFEDIDSVFLNNLGGTKMMATSTTIALLDFANEKGIELLEADVDPEKKKIYINDLRKKENLYSGVFHS